MSKKLVVCGAVAFAVVLGSIALAQAQTSTVGKATPAHAKVVKKSTAVDTTAAAAARHAAKARYAKAHPGYIPTSARPSKLMVKGKASTRHVSAATRRASHKALAAKKAPALKAAAAPKASALKTPVASKGSLAPIGKSPVAAAPALKTPSLASRTPVTVSRTPAAAAPRAAAPAERVVRTLPPAPDLSM
jgi:hypothetical protein